MGESLVRDQLVTSVQLAAGQPQLLGYLCALSWELLLLTALTWSQMMPVLGGPRQWDPMGAGSHMGPKDEQRVREAWVVILVLPFIAVWHWGNHQLHLVPQCPNI